MITLTTKAKAKDDLLYEGQDKITDKQMKFTEFYYLDKLPIKEAAMKAGYSSSTRWKGIPEYVYVQNYRKALNDDVVQRSFSLDDDMPKYNEEDRPLTPRQKLFADHYIKNPNASQAIIKAGYKVKHPNSQADKNLKKPHIKRYIEEKVNAIHSEDIADMKEIRAFWTNILRDPDANPKDQLKATEYLSRTQRAFDPPSELDIREQQTKIEKMIKDTIKTEIDVERVKADIEYVKERTKLLSGEGERDLSLLEELLGVHGQDIMNNNKA